MRLHLLPLLLALAVAVGGCGSAASSGGADPAELVPADAAFYFEAVVRPDGEQGDDVRALAGRLLRTGDPGATIRGLIDDAMREDGATPATFEKNVDPWLGDKVAVALSDLQRDEPRFIAVLAARDEDLAADEIAREARRRKARHATSGDVEYWVDPDGEASGAFGDAVIVASDEKQLQRAIAAVDGPDLAHAKSFQAALEDLPADRVGTFYLDMPRMFDAVQAQSASDPMAAAVLGTLRGKVEPVAGAVLATQDTLAVEAFGAVPGGLGSTPLVRELPAGSWGAVGVADAGKGARAMIDAFGGAIGGAVIESRLQQELGIDLDEDVFGWIGDVAGFVRGDTADALGGGIVIEVTDHDRAARAIPKLVGLARQQADARFEPVRVPGASMAFSAVVGDAPGPIVVALGDDRAVIAYGAGAAADALSPERTLSDDGLYQRAKAAADGLEPSLILGAAPVLKLIARAAGDDEDFAKARPYLEAIDLLTAAAAKDGDRLRQRSAVRLR